MMNDGSRELIHPYSMREREEERDGERRKERERGRGKIESQYTVDEGKDHKPEFHVKYCRR